MIGKGRARALPSAVRQSRPGRGCYDSDVSLPAASREIPLASVEEALDELRRGRMIVLVDDEDRENEGDLAIAAEKVTPEAINFMARFGRGLVCLALSRTC